MSHPAQPLVSVICLSYNHAAYVGEAIASVLAQTYPHVELIVVDDGSSDASVPAIRQALAGNKDIKFIALQQNIGNCRAFNLAWRQAQGDYIIDLAADDRLLPGRIARGVAALQAAGPDYGLHFCDARIINKSGRMLREHRTADFFAGEVPQGYLFETVLRKYFINPVTMMYSRAMLDSLGGYDENLAYEDFDLLVRASRRFKFCYTPEVLAEKRIVKGSLGSTQYRPRSAMLRSTLQVCRKAYGMCQTPAEYAALQVRLRYEMKMALASLNWGVLLPMFRLYRQAGRALSAAES